MKTSEENKDPKVINKNGYLISETAIKLTQLAKERKATMAKLRLAEMVYKAMLTKGINKLQLAEILGVTKQAINKFISGRNNFTVDTLIKLEQVLNTNLISNSLYPTSELKEKYSIISFNKAQESSVSFSKELYYKAWSDIYSSLPVSFENKLTQNVKNQPIYRYDLPLPINNNIVKEQEDSYVSFEQAA